MGLLRFVLALAVFNGHAALPLGFSLLAGYTAVHCFFVISGYYMAMVLTEKYGRGARGYYDFVTNRVLRLMPSYLMVMIATLVLVAWVRWTEGPALPPDVSGAALAGQGASAWIGVSGVVAQLTLLGLDVFSFITWTESSGVQLVTGETGVAASLQTLLLVPPAWSLSVELYFYLLAPFLVRMPLRAMLATMAASVLCRLALAWVLDWRTDPWSYRFFPSELVFFLTGALGYRLSVAAGGRPGAWVGGLAVCGALLGALEVMGIHSPGMGAHKWLRVPLFALLCAGVPWLFEATRRWTWDRFIGELSYPLYICHFLVIWAVGSLLPDAGEGLRRALLLLGVVALAVALQRGIDVPIDRWRQRRLARRALPDGRLAAPV